jgi:hypothetical protein
MNAGRAMPENLCGISAFMRVYPEAKPIFLSRGSERIESGGILCMNVAEFILTTK